MTRTRVVLFRNVLSKVTLCVGFLAPFGDILQVIQTGQTLQLSKSADFTRSHTGLIADSDRLEPAPGLIGSELGGNAHQERGLGEG